MTGQSFAAADPDTQDRLIDGERRTIAISEAHLAAGLLSPDGKLRALGLVEQSKATLRGWTGRDDIGQVPPGTGVLVAAILAGGKTGRLS